MFPMQIPDSDLQAPIGGSYGSFKEDDFFALRNSDEYFKILCGSSNLELEKKGILHNIFFTSSTVARILGKQPARITIKNFADGEIGIQIEENVRGADVFIIQSLCKPVNENLMQLFLMIDAAKRASAKV
jgi:hypothetical protein